MKKVPSYPKITTKTNITFTQMQKININSPKNINTSKMFKTNPKNVERSITADNKSSQKNFKLYNTHTNNVGSRKKSEDKKDCNTIQNDKKTINEQKSDEIKKLTQKLKLLEKQINKMQSQKKKQSASHRSMTQKKEKSLVSNKSALVNFQNQQFKKQKKKTLKKSYSDKNTFKMMKFNSVKNIQAIKNAKSKNSNKNLYDNTTNQSSQILKNFITQVPKSNKQQTFKYQKSSHIEPQFSQSIKISVNDSFRKNIHVSQDVPPSLYYIQHALKSVVNQSFHPIRQHIFQSIQTLNFLSNVRKPSQKQLEPHYVSLPPSKHEFCIVLDLDQTLIHCNQSLDVQHDVILPIKFPTGQKIDAGVNIRPYAIQFLKQISKLAEIIVFTASHQCYANVVLDYIDPHKKYISHRLYRDHCWQTEQGIYIKDLRVLGNRSLKNVLLVDNAAYSYFYQLENGIPIIPFYEDKNDKQLIHLLNYIKIIIIKHKNQNTALHKMNSEFFKLKNYVQFEDFEDLTKDLYEETFNAFKNQINN